MSSELNVVPEERGASVGLCSSSNSSLPTVPSEGASGVGKAFLKSEVSAENILFWQACEKFRQIPTNQKEKLNQEARSFYNNDISGSASHPINVDDTVRIEERSYLQADESCMLAYVEGRPLPELGPCSKSTANRKTAGTDSAYLSDRHKADQKPQKKPKVKPGKSLPLDVDEGAEKKIKAPQNKLTREKRQE
ncbi:unnamed protein product [Coregonus sp. 'balchen']|nr:unnamed protein product [Coregonus sp. 'balchen']